MTVESLQFRPIRRTMPANKIYVESYNMWAWSIKSDDVLLSEFHAIEYLYE